jgi:predicted negative regulator of RcsB-dependent stress response
LEGVKYFRIGNLELARSSWEEAKGYLKTEEEKAVLQIGIDRLKNQ